MNFCVVYKMREQDDTPFSPTAVQDGRVVAEVKHPPHRTA